MSGGPARTPDFGRLSGQIHVVGDDVNTDYIIASRYKTLADDLPSLVGHLFEDLDPALAGRIRPGDIVVAGHNFGSGSSRETAPRLLLAAGVAAVVARSFARIFFRNAINVGLPVVECDWDGLKDLDRLDVDLSEGRLSRQGGDEHWRFDPLPPFLLDILASGGAAAKLRDSTRHLASDMRRS